MQPIDSQCDANAVHLPRHSGFDPESSVCKHLDTGLRGVTDRYRGPRTLCVLYAFLRVLCVK